MNLLEAQCLYAVGRVLKGHVPVLEVYAWRVDGKETFMYMVWIEGETLERVWNSMTASERVSICSELRRVYDKLRQLVQNPLDSFVGRQFNMSLLPCLLIRPG